MELNNLPSSIKRINVDYYKNNKKLNNLPKFLEILNIYDNYSINNLPLNCKIGIHKKWWI